jgi:hypothetical protein
MTEYYTKASSLKRVPDTLSPTFIDGQPVSEEKFHATHWNSQQPIASRVFSPSREAFSQRSSPAEIQRKDTLLNEESMIYRGNDLSKLLIPRWAETICEGSRGRLRQKCPAERNNRIEDLVAKLHKANLGGCQSIPFIASNAPLGWPRTLGASPLLLALPLKTVRKTPLEEKHCFGWNRARTTL